MNLYMRTNQRATRQILSRNVFSPTTPPELNLSLVLPGPIFPCDFSSRRKAWGRRSECTLEESNCT